ncbi:MAG TPA: aminoglycoside 6-adenylyltransferase [Gaiellaceae bacterium]
MIEDLVSAWARDEENIRALAVVGSQARTETPADDWSDLDLVVFARNPGELIDREDWVARFGSVRITFLEDTAVGGQRERRVLYETGEDVDFAVVPAELLDRLDRPSATALADVTARGIRVLLDKDGSLGRALAGLPAPEAPRPPSEQELREVAMDFWYHALWSARKLRRRELFVAKQCIDGDMKQRLLRVLEWQARARNPGTDTWHRGRFLEQWADPGALEELREAYGRYDEGELGRALEATMRLFGRLARETAERLGLAYPVAAEEFATGYVHRLLWPERP